uniref:Arrestin_C domain-containing protein n=1 Tax=Panagrellus redivivus TaxID=6233 RepID=A0A7E4VFF8_PANRE
MEHQNFSSVAEFTITHDALRTALFDVAIPTTTREVRGKPDFQWWLECYPAGDRYNMNSFMVNLRVSGKDALCKVQYEIGGDRGEVAILASTRFRRSPIYSIGRDRLLESGADVTFKCEVTVEQVRDRLMSSNPNMKPAISFRDTIELSVWHKTKVSLTAKRPIDVDGTTVWWLRYSLEKKEDHNKLTVCMRTSASHCDVSLTCQNVWNMRSETIVKANPDRDRCIVTLKFPKQRRVFVKCTADFSFSPKAFKPQNGIIRPKPASAIVPTNTYGIKCTRFLDPSAPKWPTVRPSFIENRDGVTVGLLLPRRLLEEGAGYKALSEKKKCPGGFDWTIVCESDSKVDEDGETKRMIVVSWQVSSKSLRAEVTYAVPQAGLRQRRKLCINERDPTPKPIFSIDYDTIKMKPDETHVHVTCNFVFPVPSMQESIKMDASTLPCASIPSKTPSCTSVTVRISRDAHAGVKSLPKTTLYGCKWWIEVTPYTLVGSKSFYAYLCTSSLSPTPLQADFEYTVNHTTIRGEMSVLVVRKKKFLFKVPANSHDLTYFVVKCNVTFSDALRLESPESNFSSSGSSDGDFAIPAGTSSNPVVQYLNAFYERYQDKTTPSETGSSDDEIVECLPLLLPTNETPKMPSKLDEASSIDTASSAGTESSDDCFTDLVDCLHGPLSLSKSSDKSNGLDKTPSEADSSDVESLQCLPRVVPVKVSCDLAKAKSSTDSSNFVDRCTSFFDPSSYDSLKIESSDDVSTNVDPVKDSYDLDKTQSSGDDLSDVDNVCNPLPSNTSYDLDEAQSIETDSNDIEIGVMNPLPIMKPSQTTPNRDEAQSSDKDSSNVERQQYMMPYY